MNPLSLTAQGPIDLGDALKVGAGKSTSVADIYQNPADLVNVIVPILFIIGGIILFIFILYGGFLYIQDEKKGPEDAKKIWQTALVGFIVMFVAYWIVQLIEIITGVTIFG